MTSVLSSLFSRDPKQAFPYELPSSSFYSFDGISVGKSFKRAEPSEMATCFWTSSELAPGSVLKAQAHKLKTLRHPNVLAYLDSVEMNGTFYLITEACVPLETYITESKLNRRQKEYVVSWGLFQLMSCLKFLHQEAKLSHENVRHSVYVTEGGDWKLGGFEKCISFSNPRADLNSLALLTWRIFNGFNETMTKPETPRKVPQQLVEQYKKMVTSQAAKLDTGELLKELRTAGGFLKNRYVDTLLFLDEFQLKDAHEKQGFFMRLSDDLDMFPDNIAKYRILPKLIYSYEYGDAGSHILMPLFRLGRLLDEDEYQRRIVPCLCKLFSSPDRVTRVKLLERIDEMALHLTPQIVNERIYGNIASGFMDTNPAVRESTVKAMVSLAEKLNNQNLNTDLMRHLARLQGADDQPGIRTNATICLGKIGCYIDPSQRERILISAFTRALKDPFPPARLAAILALSATQQYYSLTEVACRVLPALSPMTCDPEKQVRDQSFKALHGFIEKLEKASENPDLIPELEAQVKAGGRSSLLSSDKVPQWASWALKSLSGKFYKGTLSASHSTTSINKDETSSRESTPSIATKSSEIQPRKHADDGWSDLEDGSSKESEDKWENDSEIVVDGNQNDSGWDDEWKEVTVTENKAPVTRSANSPRKTRSGGLKFQNAAKKLAVEDDLGCLLGIKPELNRATQLSDSANKSTSKPPAKVSTGASDKWVDSSIVTGWDDFATNAAYLVTQNKEIHETQINVRNEAQRKENARKRTSRGIGAIRIGSGCDH